MAGQASGKVKYKEIDSFKGGRSGVKVIRKKGPAYGGSKSGNPTKRGKIAGNNGK